MYIPSQMKKIIANVFYDKEVSVIEQKVMIDAEGGVNIKSYEDVNKFKGNVSFSNCKKIQEDYGIDYDIDISITTDYNMLKINDIIKYQDVLYIITDVMAMDSHFLILAKKWQI